MSDDLSLSSSGKTVLSLGPDLCRDFRSSCSREWLETNGRGGYALGPVADGATRGYHGFLTVARRPPLGRFQLVNRLEESMTQGNTRWDLSCQQYPGLTHPAGAEMLTSFKIDPFPTWTYDCAVSAIEKSYFLRYGEDTGVVTYRLVSGLPVEIDVRPMLSFRDHNARARRDDRFDGKLHWSRDALDVDLGDGVRLTLRATAGRLDPDPMWFNAQFYGEEDHRGGESLEDVFGPGVFRFSLTEGKPVSLIFSTAGDRPPSVEKWREEERDQRQKIARGSLVRGALGGALSLAADQFVVSRGTGSSVIAGYPWFGDWSRDALASFPGLFLATGRWSEAPGFIETFVRHFRQGMLPNFFPEGPESPSYNAADAPLWFIRAVQAYHRATHDDDTVRRWLPVLRDIVDAFQNGAWYDIHMDGDGLIVTPPAELALTWMDVRVDGKSLTPRSGKPVEIQALWYNALQFLVEIQLKLGQPTRGYDQLAEVARKSFNQKFWNEPAGYLFDVVDGKYRDESVRPNALLAVSLPYEVLEENRFLPVVELARQKLLTPWGLRTLSPDSPIYRGRCAGTLAERDKAYHQGTVWPWLLGPFMTAFVKAHGATEETKKHLVGFLRPFHSHLTDAGVGQVSEIFDGDAPHAPRGCPAFAWSVGELLRVMWEEGLTL